jgi:hypothetical protein
LYERLPYVSRSLLGFSLNCTLWLRSYLKNRSLLTFAQERQEHDLAVGKFERIARRGGNEVRLKTAGAYRSVLAREAQRL